MSFGNELTRNVYSIWVNCNSTEKFILGKKREKRVVETKKKIGLIIYLFYYASVGPHSICKGCKKMLSAPL